MRGKSQVLSCPECKESCVNLKALEEVVCELDILFTNLCEIFFEVIHTGKMIDTLALDRRMDELEGKYPGIMAYIAGKKEKELQSTSKYD